MKAPLILNDGTIIPHYGMQWWKMQYRSKDIIYARGILGQFIIAIPELNAVVVRLGHKRGDKDLRCTLRLVLQYRWTAMASMGEK